MEPQECRLIGSRLGQHLVAHKVEEIEGQRLIALMSDLCAGDLDLMAPFRTVAHRDSFRRLIKCALSGKGYIYKASILHEIESIYSSRVVVLFESFLDGLLSLEERSSSLSTVSSRIRSGWLARAPMTQGGRFRIAITVCASLLTAFLFIWITHWMRSRRSDPYPLNLAALLFRPDCPEKKVSRQTELPATLLLFQGGRLNECTVVTEQKLECGGQAIHARFNANTLPEPRIDVVESLILDDSKGQRFQYVVDEDYDPNRPQKDYLDRVFPEIYSKGCSVQYMPLGRQHFTQKGNPDDKLLIAWTRRFGTFSPTAVPE